MYTNIHICTYICIYVYMCGCICVWFTEWMQVKEATVDLRGYSSGMAEM